jgi:hypothetical protein
MSPSFLDGASPCAGWRFPVDGLVSPSDEEVTIRVVQPRDDENRITAKKTIHVFHMDSFFDWPGSLRPIIHTSHDETWMCRNSYDPTGLERR